MTEEAKLIARLNALRDEFAKAAMQAIVTGLANNNIYVDCDYVAGGAYQIADSMMEARKK